MKIFITGANRGLGLALATFAAERGHTVIAGSRNGDKPKGELTKLKERFPNQILILAIDVTDEQSVADAAKRVSMELASIDVIINNAGVLLDRGVKIEDLDLSLFDQTMDVNLYGPIRIVKHFLPLLFQGSNQTIINISSDAGSITKAYGGDFSYGISKAALNMFSKQIRQYVAEKNIAVLAVHPGWIKTDMGGENATGSPQDTARNLLDIIEKKKNIDHDQFFIHHNGDEMPI